MPDGKVAGTWGKSEDLPDSFLKAFEEKAGETRGAPPHVHHSLFLCGFQQETET